MTKEKPTKEEKATKARRIRTIGRLLYFLMAVGAIGSTVVLTMLLSRSDLQPVLNVIAGLNGVTAVFFVMKLIVD